MPRIALRIPARSVQGLCVIATLVFAATAWSTSSVSPPYTRDARPSFKFWSIVHDSVRVGRPTLVTAWAIPNGAIPVGIRLRIPPTLELVRGDSVRTTTETAAWAFVPRTPGTHVIEGVCSISVPGAGVEEVAWTLSLTTGKTARGDTEKRVREERLLEGQKYRLGDLAPVPIDSSEDFTMADLSRDAQRARPVEPVIAADTTAWVSTAGRRFIQVPEAGFRVRVLAIVDATGNVLRAIPNRQTAGGPQSAGANAAASAIRRARFEPTRFRGRTVADAVEVEVRVVSASK